MADDKTTKTPEQPVTDSGPGKETPPAPPKEPEKVSVSPKPEAPENPFSLPAFHSRPPSPPAGYRRRTGIYRSHARLPPLPGLPPL